MRKLILLATVLLLAGCKSKKITADSSQRYILENLAEVASAENLREIYPNAQMSEGTDLFEEGTVERPFTILYPGTDKEILLTWEDNSRSRLHNIRLDKDGEWESETGIKIGTTYEELVRLNGGKFNVYGFGWDYSGAVDWNGGKLSKTNVRVFLAPQDTPPSKFYGDQIIEPSEEEIRELDLKVGSILYQEGA